MTTKATTLHLENGEVLYLFENPNVRDDRYWKFIRMITTAEFPPENKIKFTAKDCVGLYCLECNLRLSYTLGNSNSVRRHMQKKHLGFLEEFPIKKKGPKTMKTKKRPIEMEDLFEDHTWYDIDIVTVILTNNILCIKFFSYRSEKYGTKV